MKKAECRMKNKTLRVRPPLARMAYIRRLLLRGESFNAGTVADQLGVSAKTVHRDIEYLRGFLNYEITYVRQFRSYSGRPSVITTI